MSDFVGQGQTLGRARLLGADGVFVGIQVWFCLGLVGTGRLLELVLLVAAWLVGYCSFIGIRDSATALLGGRGPDGGPDPRLSFASSLVVVAIWVPVLLALAVGFSGLTLPQSWRGVLFAVAALAVCAAARAARWLWSSHRTLGNSEFVKDGRDSR